MLQPYRLCREGGQPDILGDAPGNDMSHMELSSTPGKVESPLAGMRRAVLMMAKGSDWFRFGKLCL